MMSTVMMMRMMMTVSVVVKRVAMVAVEPVVSVMVTMMSVMMTMVSVMHVVGRFLITFRGDIVTFDHFDFITFSGFPFVPLLGNGHREGALCNEGKNQQRRQKSVHSDPFFFAPPFTIANWNDYFP